MKVFNETYKSLSVDFDSLYYESQTYLTGKEIVEQGLRKKLFFLEKLFENISKIIPYV